MADKVCVSHSFAGVASSGASTSSSSSDAVVRGVDVSLLDVSDEDVGDVLDGLMSIVTGGLVLVMVWVVVGLDVLVAVAENDGST